MLNGLNRKVEDPAKLTAEIINKNSPLMQAASTKGRMYAASRGLLNSSMAAQAGSRAALDAAVPLASQAARQNFQHNISEQGYQQQRGLAEQGFGFRTTLEQQRYQQQRGLAEQGFGFKKSLAEQGYKQQIGLEGIKQQNRVALNQQGFNFDRALQHDRIVSQQQLARLDRETRFKLQQMDSSLQQSIANMKIAADKKREANSMITAMQNAYSTEIRSILANPDIGASDRNELLKSAGDLMKTRTRMVENLFHIKIDWNAGRFGTTTKRTPAPSPAPRRRQVPWTWGERP